MKTEYLITILLLFTTFILSGLVCLLEYILYKEKVSFPPDMLTRFAMPCNDLSLSADEDAENLEYKVKGLDISVNSRGQYICSETKPVRLFGMVFERQTRLRASKGQDGIRYLSCGNEQLRPKTGRLSVIFSKLSQIKNISETNDILVWDSLDRNTYIDKLAQYNGGMVTVTEGRTYFIYGSVHLNISHKDQENNKYYHRPQIFSLRICKNINGYEQTLVGSTKMFNVTSEYITSSLRVGGHFTMSRNDIIYIKASNANMLIQNSKGNSFGLFPL